MQAWQWLGAIFVTFALESYPMVRIADTLAYLAEPYH
jgi:hypothetical protein